MASEPLTHLVGKALQTPATATYPFGQAVAVISAPAHGIINFPLAAAQTLLAAVTPASGQAVQFGLLVALATSQCLHESLQTSHPILLAA